MMFLFRNDKLCQTLFKIFFIIELFFIIDSQTFFFYKYDDDLGIKQYL